MPLIRSDLRLALTAGLANAFATLSPLPFGIYMPLAVLAVCSGTLGGSMVLGQQRILGSLLGMALLILGMKGLGTISFPLAIALTLGTLRLLGGLLGLEVGYKVGGFIVVMGWLVHDQQLASWVPLRLFWTVAGILVGVLSMRLLWPARALPQAWRNLGAMLDAIAKSLDQVADQLDQPNVGDGGDDGSSPVQALRQQLGGLRGGWKAVQSELGDSGRHHPQIRLMLTFQEACSALVMVVDGLLRHAPAPGATGNLVALQQGEADLLRAVADRLRQWSPLIAQAGSDPLGPPPQPAWAAPDSWRQLQPLLTDNSFSEDDLPRLRRHASRLVLCGQAERTMARTELLWRSLASGAASTQPTSRQPATHPGRVLP